MPYKIQKTDIAAVVAEANLFFTILVRSQVSSTTILLESNIILCALAVHVDVEIKSCRGVPDADVLRHRDLRVQLYRIDSTAAYRSYA